MTNVYNNLEKCTINSVLTIALSKFRYNMFFVSQLTIATPRLVAVA